MARGKRQEDIAAGAAKLSATAEKAAEYAAKRRADAEENAEQAAIRRGKADEERRKEEEAMRDAASDRKIGLENEAHALRLKNEQEAALIKVIKEKGDLEEAVKLRIRLKREQQWQQIRGNIWIKQLQKQPEKGR